jgi:hypothetical protein
VTEPSEEARKVWREACEEGNAVDALLCDNPDCRPCRNAAIIIDAALAAAREDERAKVEAWLVEFSTERLADECERDSEVIWEAAMAIARHEHLK